VPCIPPPALLEVWLLSLLTRPSQWLPRGPGGVVTEGLKCCKKQLCERGPGWTQ